MEGYIGQGIFAIATQGVGAIISGVQGAKSAYDQDRNICYDYNQTLQAITNINALTSTINKDIAQQMATNADFMKLNTTIKAEKEAIQKRKKTFMFKVYVTIVVNVFLTLIVLYNILY
jgi:hypothetical protein